MNPKKANQPIIIDPAIQKNIAKNMTVNFVFKEKKKQK
jgi:hypothetical protein